ncbi:izumo sperm-egg fusion protein 1 isoform X2 [Poeciliopsis prolifica]|uniref:izumo sperm-egg fusion protein 1 isoform X2 n=1 Tax=Poeciliopsis prolifica TaxID=188132 RepID=UPI0024133BD4|nr:izumo sperm-egg fusion protein 1 isoform X2 [Poeciliopsis prolifica]
MLLVVVLLLHRIVTAEACLQCDRTIKTMHEDYILSASSVAEQITFQMISDQAFVSYKKTSQSRKGVIDPTTLYRAKTEYQSEFHRFLNAPRVVHTVQGEEEGQVVLNCFLPWHRFILGKPEYHYSRAIGEADATKLTEKDFQPLVVTQDASIILNQLHLDEQGTYRCSLQDENGAVYYRAAFLLTVEPLALQTRQPFVTLPPLAHGVSSTENRLVVLIVVVTALSLAASVGLIVLLRTMMNRQKQVKDMRIKKNGKRTKATV